MLSGQWVQFRGILALGGGRRHPCGWPRAPAPARRLSAGAGRNISVFPPLPVPSDPPQKILQLNGGRRLSYTDEGSGENGQVRALSLLIRIFPSFLVCRRGVGGL